MSDVIKLLPDSVANQIAAGEVIQRPASVIKELVENSVDAGASFVQIVIKDAGRTLIQVIDNGKGMTETDARMAFERHATSKILNASDLFNLSTMGFRGEALPSICAVSSVEIKTKISEAPVGTRLLINASKVESQEPVVCESGTNIMVKNLFFNVPARRKFLKGDNVEMSNILREFERLALVNNNIRMMIDYNGKVVDLRRASFKQRIVDLWKSNIEESLLPLEVETSLIKISGYITRPEYARRRNPLQYLIVNGRNMRHPYFHKAITSCYETLIAPETQPCYFLKFEVDPSSIDVNIHPTKNEIKFEYEQEIWPILKAAVKAALGKFGAVPSIDFSLDVISVKPVEKDIHPQQPTISLKGDYSPTPIIGNGGNSYNTYSGSQNNKFKQKDWESLYSDFMKNAGSKEEKKDSYNGVLPGFDVPVEVENICMQHASKYIVTSYGSKVYVIHQRRAHVRILYEEYLKRLTNDRIVSQRLMFPENFTLDSSQLAVFENIQKQLESIGFQLEIKSGNEIAVISVPAILQKLDYSDLIKAFIDSFMEDGINFGKNQDENKTRIEKIALIMARKSAIPTVYKLSDEEMESIVCDLFSLEEPSLSPDGNLIYMQIDDSRLDTYFS